MTVACTACEGQGSHERVATPTEVDNGCELGVAYDECEVCRGRGVVFDIEQVVDDAVASVEASMDLPEGVHVHYDKTSVVRISKLSPDGLEVRETWERRPDGSYVRNVDRPPVEEIATLLGVADHESFDAQAEMGQGPPA